MADADKPLKIDPCPFCGFDQGRMVSTEQDTEHRVICAACGASGPVRCCFEYQDPAAVRAMAADDWNERIDLPAAASIDETLSEAQALIGAVNAAANANVVLAITAQFYALIKSIPAEDAGVMSSDILTAIDDFQAAADKRLDALRPAEALKEHLTDEEIKDLVSASFDLGVSFAEGEAQEQPREEPSVESPATADELGATTDPEPDNGGSVVDSPNSCAESVRGPTTAVPQDPSGIDEGRVRSDPPGGGGGNGTQKRKYKKRRSTARDKANRHPIAERIEAYFKAAGCTVYSGSFSISDQGIKNILDGTYPRAVTLNTIERELDKLEKSLSAKKATVEDMKKEDPAGEVGPSIAGIPADFPVEELPNSLPPIKRLNPLPSMTPPARCSKVT